MIFEQLGDLTHKHQTWSPAKEAKDCNFTYIDLSSVDQTLKAVTSTACILGSEAPSRARQLVKSNDVLVSTVRPNLNSVAKVTESLDGATASTGFCVLRANPERLCSNYLMHWVRTPTFVNEMVKLSTGANYPAVSDRIIKNSKIPLPMKNGKPDLLEQQRIAEILDQADAIRRKRQQALQLTDDFLRATFLDLFGDPVTNPKGWPQDTLGNLTTIDAPMVDPKDPTYSKLLHYGPDRIEKNTGKLLPAKTATEDGLISGKFLCSEGEILYSKIRPNLNKVALVKERCLCSADVYPVKPNKGKMTVEYLATLLRSDAFLKYVAEYSRRANIPKVNRTQFAGYLAPVPPWKLQEEFSRIVIELENTKKKLESSLGENLFASLQQRAFKGEL